MLKRRRPASAGQLERLPVQRQPPQRALGLRRRRVVREVGEQLLVIPLGHVFLVLAAELVAHRRCISASGVSSAFGKASTKPWSLAIHCSCTLTRASPFPSVSGRANSAHNSRNVT